MPELFEPMSEAAVVMTGTEIPITARLLGDTDETLALDDILDALRFLILQ